MRKIVKDESGVFNLFFVDFVKNLVYFDFIVGLKLCVNVSFEI